MTPALQPGVKALKINMRTLLQFFFYFYFSVLIQLFFPSLSTVALYLCPHPVFSLVLLFMVFVSGLAVSFLH